MDYKTLLVADIPHGISITLNRLEQRNSLNSVILGEIHQALDAAEKNSACRLIVLKGQQGIFCTGMDFSEISQVTVQKENAAQFAGKYMGLLKRFATLPKIIVALIEGQVMAGGVGLVAASDIVIATNKSQFTLSEALWGLLPANVLPYLIRRIGFQKSYFMTLTTQAMTAADAYACHLVDELSDDPTDALRKHTIRLARLNEQTIHDLKAYFRKLWLIDDKMEKLALDELARLMQESRVQNNIKRYVQEGKFPWETINE